MPLRAISPDTCLRLSDGTTGRVREVQVASLRGAELARAPHLHPVLIRRDSLGAGRPERDILVSPNARFHGLAALSLFAGATPGGLVSAKHLAGLRGVHRLEPLSCRFVHPVLAAPAAATLEGLLLHLAPLHHMTDAWSHAARTELDELFGTTGRSRRSATLRT